MYGQGIYRSGSARESLS